MLVKTVVGRPTTFLVAFALLAAFGLYTATNVSIDLLPSIEPPILAVTTSYPGAGPEEVERAITRPMESVLSNVSNLRQLNSTTRQGSSQVTLDFVWGTNMDEATNELRDRLEMVKAMLPEDAGAPTILKFDPALLPIMELRLAGARSPEELRELALNLAQPRLEQIEGVARAAVQGGRDRVIRVDLSRSLLDAYGLTIGQVAQALRAQNISLSAGRLAEGEIDYVVRAAGEFTSLRELEDAAVGQRAGRAVRLGDLGRVYEGYRAETNKVLINGEPGVSLSVQQQSGSNAVQVADRVLAALESINRQLPPGVRLELIRDSTQLIRNSLSSVSSQAGLGAVLAVVILFIFLRSAKSTVIVAISIPTSIIVTVTTMYFAGLTLNLMTLAGLALGVGLLVDNSIVILENIYRYRERGAKLRPSAMLGTQEMLNAIVAATLTTICVFLPLWLFRAELEIAGVLFADLAFTVVISLAASLAVAVLLVPVLAGRYVPLVSRAQRPLKGALGAIDGAMDRLFTGLDNAYKAALRKVLSRKAATAIVTALLLAGSLALVPLVGWELFPPQPRDSVQFNVRLPVGTRLALTEEVVYGMERFIRDEIRGYKDIVLQIGSGGSHAAAITITLPEFEDRIETAEDIEAKLRPYFDRYPGVSFSFRSGGVNVGLGGGSAIDIRVRGDNSAAAEAAANRIVDLMKERVPEAADPRANISQGLPQLDVILDRERAYALGLNAAAAGQELRANLEGVTASRFRRGGSEFDIVVALDPADRTQVLDLDRIYVANSMGLRVPLASVASYRRTTGPVTIQRNNQAREIRVQAGLAPGARIDRVDPLVRAAVAEGLALDDDVILEYRGDFADLRRYGGTFVAVIIMAVLLVYGVMAAQFESFADPFIILFTIPLTAIGVVGIHFIMGVKLSIFSAVGLVMLIGIVVNNGIVLVDYSNLLRRRGLPIVEACVEAGGNRLRPILMTNLTTILGLVPVSFLKAEGSELIQPIGLTVIGGLSASALLTLFFVPVVYAAFSAAAERRAAARVRRLERSFEHRACEEEPS